MNISCLDVENSTLMGIYLGTSPLMFLLQEIRKKEKHIHRALKKSQAIEWQEEDNPNNKH